MKSMRILAPYIHHAASFLVGLFLCLTTVGEVKASGGIETAGDVLQLVLPATAVGLTIGLKDGKGALQFGESATLTLGVTYGLKYAVDEKRPNGGRHSFPSGHTSISFSAAEFMCERYGWEYGIPAYVAASFVGYSRVESRQHHPQDVAVGAGIGVLSSYIFTEPYKGWHVQADAHGKYHGIALSHTF